MMLNFWFRFWPHMRQTACQIDTTSREVAEMFVENQFESSLDGIVVLHASSLRHAPSSIHIHILRIQNYSCYGH